MKTIQSFLNFTLACVLTGYSCSSSKNMQRSKDKDFVDAQYEVTWNFTFMKDTISMTKGNVDRYILLIGENYTYADGYLRYKSDSLQGHPEAFLEEFKKGTSSGLITHVLMATKLYKDFTKKKLSVIDHISVNFFIYEEPLIPQNWKVQDDTMTIAGYSCQKALCDWRGRSYIAWFSAGIPMNEGPWKFFGLPGLIVKIYDTKHHYDFELVAFNITDKKIDIQPLLTKRDSKGSLNYKLQPIERKEFLAMKFGTKGYLTAKADMAKVEIQHEQVEKKYRYLELDY